MSLFRKWWAHNGTMVSAIPSIVAKCKKALEEDTIQADVRNELSPNSLHRRRNSSSQGQCWGKTQAKLIPNQCINSSGLPHLPNWKKIASDENYSKTKPFQISTRNINTHGAVFWLCCFVSKWWLPKGSLVRIMWGSVYARVFRKLWRAIAREVAGGSVIVTLEC